MRELQPAGSANWLHDSPLSGWAVQGFNAHAIQGSRSRDNASNEVLRPTAPGMGTIHGIVYDAIGTPERLRMPWGPTSSVSAAAAQPGAHYSWACPMAEALMGHVCSYPPHRPASDGLAPSRGTSCGWHGRPREDERPVRLLPLLYALCHVPYGLTDRMAIL